MQPADNVDLTVTGHALGDTTGATFTRAPGATPLAISGGGCSININTNVAHCGVGPGGAFRFTTADRADRIDASGTQLPFDESAPEQFDSAGGDDVLFAGPLNDTVDAGAGDDTITGGPGADQLHGDAGDDTFVGLSAGDVVDGGDGVDILDLSGIARGRRGRLARRRRERRRRSDPTRTSAPSRTCAARRAPTSSRGDQPPRPSGVRAATTRSTPAAAGSTRSTAAPATTPRAWTPTTS